MSKKSSHPHLNGNFDSMSSLLATTSIAAAYQGKIAVVLAGPMQTPNEMSLRRSELDGLAIGAAIDAKEIKGMDQKNALYQAFRAGFIRAYEGGESQAVRHGLDGRQTLVSLRQALSIDENHQPHSGNGMIGTMVAQTYNDSLKGVQIGAGSIS